MPSPVVAVLYESTHSDDDHGRRDRPDPFAILIQ